MENNRPGNQADRLMELFQEISANDHTKQTLLEEKETTTFEDTMIELDVLKLPPRKEVHETKRQPYTFRITMPMLRFSFIVLLAISYLTYLYVSLGDGIISFFQ